MGTRDRKPEDWAVDAKEYLRKLLIGKTVDVQMEYNRKIPQKESSTTLLELIFQGLALQVLVLVWFSCLAMSRSRMHEATT